MPRAAIEAARSVHAGTVEDNFSADESFSYPPSPFIEEAPAPRSFVSRLIGGAVLGSILVFTGVQVASSHAPATQNQVAVVSGVQTMSAGELIQNVKSQGKSVYWINTRAGDSYSESSATLGVHQIFYRAEGSDASLLNQFDVMIGTYQDQATYDAQPHPFLSGESSTLNLSTGATLTYNQTASNRAIVTFPDKPEIIVLNYPTTQAVPIMINDAESLVLIS